MKPVYILAIQTGHSCTAALLKDGEITGVISEERFNRIKNYAGFPDKSIQWLLANSGITADQLDAVAFCGEQFIAPFSELSGAKGGKTLLGHFASLYGTIEYKAGRAAPFFARLKQRIYDAPRSGPEKNKILEHLEKKHKIPREKVFTVGHHLCHTYAAYYGLRDKPEKNAAIVTLDGEGDDACATVSVVKDENIRLIATTWRQHSLGYIYSKTTQFLGMKPLEHEYKVMGLAPYAASKEQQYYLSTYKNVFENSITLNSKNPLKFTSNKPTNRFDSWLREKAVGERFDNMAGAVQHLTEEVVSRWIRAVIRQTKADTIYASGGVFMNVKMNMILANLPEVKKIKILPSCGDESNPIGGAYYLYKQVCEENKQPFAPKRIEQLYLGPSFDDEVETYITKNRLQNKYYIRDANPKEVAKLLAQGEIVARCTGRMEWGARSLGNRAILANPSDLRYVWEINEQIKMRDFWMPFAPSMLAERAKDYIENPKELDGSYMIMAFQSKPLARKELRAAMHQADFTLRPQLVQKEWNPEYWQIIKEFERLTGIGAVLNTSFNLHGKPIVMTPKDAIEETFEQSGLKHLILGNKLLSKR